MKNVTKLVVGFWFGFKRPTRGEDSMFRIEFDGENLLNNYNHFKNTYEEFKRRNTNNDVPYKSCLENEECCIFFPKPVGPKFTTFMEVHLMSTFLDNQQKEFQKTIEELNKEMEFLEKQKQIFENLKT